MTTLMEMDEDELGSFSIQPTPNPDVLHIFTLAKTQGQPNMQAWNENFFLFTASTLQANCVP